MYNEFEILKNASLTLDSDDIVKSAGFVQNISNFLKRLVSPKYRDKVEQLTDRFDDVRGLLSDLNTATQNVQDAIQSADVNTYEQNLNEVRILIKHLSERLGQMEESAEQASVVTAPQKSEKSESKSESKSELKPETNKPEEIPGILEGYKQRHPVGYDMPISDSINKSYQDFDHLKKAKVIISDKSKDFNLRRFFVHELRRAAFPIEVFGDSKKVNALFDALINGIYEGTVLSNQYAIDSKNPPPDPAEGLTRITIETPNIEVPELNLSFKADVVLNDFGAQIRPRPELSIFRIPRIWDVKYSGKAPSIIPAKTKSGKKALFLIVPEYSQNEESKKDIAQVKEELKKRHNVDEIIDATADKIDLLTKHFVDEGYDIIGTEQYRPKMSARMDILKKIAWWDPDKIPSDKIPSVTKAPSTKAPSIPTLKADKHKWARDILERAFIKVMGREPTLTELQLAQSVALIETTYGTGWKGEGRNSNNWGAIQCSDCPNKGKPVNGKCPPGSFYQQDSNPTSSGKQQIYHWCYKSYPTPEDGAAGLIKQIFINKNRKDLTLEAAENKSVKDFSAAMYDSKYYAGTKPTREGNINSHFNKMNKAIAAITSALNEKPQFKDYRNTFEFTGGFQSPIKSSWRTSGIFDPVSIRPNGKKGHFGVDMRAPEGTSIYPFLPGIVTNVGTDPSGGNVINIQHGNGFRTYYAHLSGFNVNKGDKVDNNTVIGSVGNSGNAMHTFPHLHFQVWKNNQIQNPANFFTVPSYTDVSADERRQMVARKTETTEVDERLNPEEIKEFERMLWSAANGSQLNHVVKNAIARKLLPKSNVLVITKDASDDYVNMLCKSLHKLFGAEISTRKNGSKIEINCIVAGNEKIVTNAVQAVCDYVSKGYEIINKQMVKTAVYPLTQMRK
jgi:murein DD-endopeptidase MepM/ murein hydrolase activator NlpD